MIKIVTDTLSDMPAELAGKLGVTLIPIYVHLGDETYQDSVDITPDEFFQKIEHISSPPQTSVPAPTFIASVFKKLSQEADEILAILSSSKISAMCSSALRAKGMVGGSCRIEVFDSLLTLAGEMFLVILAQEQVNKGASLDDTLKILRETLPKIHIRGVLDTLDYLSRGGRIGRAQTLAGGAVKTIPVIELKDGESYPSTRVRTRGQAIDNLVNFVRSFPHIEMLAIEEATTPEDARNITRRLGNIVPPEKLYINKFSAAVGAHTGPGALSVSLLEAS